MTSFSQQHLLSNDILFFTFIDLFQKHIFCATQRYKQTHQFMQRAACPTSLPLSLPLSSCVVTLQQHHFSECQLFPILHLLRKMCFFSTTILLSQGLFSRLHLVCNIFFLNDIFYTLTCFSWTTPFFTAKSLVQCTLVFVTLYVKYIEWHGQNYALISDLWISKDPK